MTNHARRSETKLAQWRRERGIAQEDLARATGISRSVYWRLETGRINNPPLRYLVNLSLALQVSLDDLIEDEWREWLELDPRASKPPTPKDFWGRLYRG